MLLGVVIAALPTPAEPLVQDQTIVIATRDAPPFAIRSGQGWEGITIDLMRRMADERGLSVDFREMGLTGMLEAVAEEEVTAAASALTITAQRERVVDFTHPFFTSGLGIAVAEREAMTWITALERVFSAPFLHSLAALLATLHELIAPPSADWDAAWAQECGDRLAAYRRGEIAAVDADEAMATLRVRHGLE